MVNDLEAPSQGDGSGDALLHAAMPLFAVHDRGSK